MTNFKYLRVVEDGTNKVVPKLNRSYRVIDFDYDEHHRSLIEPIHGTTPEMAAQKYLFENTREFMVHVKIMLPEFKYERFNTVLMTRNPAIQKLLKDETFENE